MITQTEEGRLAEVFLDKAFKKDRYPAYLVSQLANIIHTAKEKTRIEIEFKHLPRGEKKEFMIGQRVILGQGGMKEIGRVVNSDTGTTCGVWVYSTRKGYASDYALDNVQPLPNGQL